MTITATVQLQDMDANTRVFVAAGAKAHGKGEVGRYEVIGSSWDRVRGVLKTFNVIGAHRVKANSVISYTRDIGVIPERLRRIQ